MKIFGYNLNKKEVKIAPGHVGVFIPEHNIKKAKIIDSGVFEFYDYKNKHFITQTLKVEQTFSSSSVEAFTKENLDVKLTYAFTVKVNDPLSVIHVFGIKNTYSMDPIADSVKIFFLEQLNEILKKKIITREALNLTGQKQDIITEVKEEIIQLVATKDIDITFIDFQITNIVLSRSILSLISSDVENQMKAKMELESARTKVAIARTLKNASELLKNDSVAMELKKLDVIEKIGGRGKTQIVFHMRNDDGAIKEI